MRNQDELLKDRLSEFLEHFQAALDQCHVNSHLRTRPIDHEWVDRDSLLIHLNDVESINEMDVRCLQEALGVPAYWSVAPLHLNRLRVTFHCLLNRRPA
jgi:hypothetical protein